MYGYRPNYRFNHNDNFNRGVRPGMVYYPIPQMRFTSPQGFVYGRTVDHVPNPDYNRNLDYNRRQVNDNQHASGRAAGSLLSNSLVSTGSKRSHTVSRKESSDEPQKKKQKNTSKEETEVPGTFNENDKITENIWRYYQQYRQSDQQYRNKVDLRDALYAIFEDVFPYCGLYIVGSSMSGFATKSSDMDLCLMLSLDEIEGKREAAEILMAIQRALRKCLFIQSCQLIRARVPILKFDDAESGTECDLNINNSVGIRNTHLLRYYAAIGVTPPVLESVQKLYPDLFDFGEDIRNLKMNVRISFKSQNSSSIGDLFLGFLMYYTNFDYEKDVISVRLGCKIPIHMVMRQTPIGLQKQWTCLKIEEPFDRSNTARSCFDPQTFMRVEHVFGRSYKRLKQTRDPESILSIPF